MRVLYDHQAFQMQRFGGISRYFIEIITHFPDIIQTEIAIRYSENVYLKQANLLSELQSLYIPKDPFFRGVEFRGKHALLRLINKYSGRVYTEPEELNKQFVIQRLLNKDFDIFHPTYYDDYFLRYIGNKPFVLTIHDMIHELYPEFYSNDLSILNVKRVLAKRASHIIAVSESTKQDVVNIFNISPDKITVIYHASSILEVKQDPPPQLPKKYVLYVGDRKRYKNFLFFIYAIYPFLNKDKSLSVVCIGSEFQKDEKSFFSSLGVDSQILGFVADDRDMYYLYNKAELFVFPSYCEGFGIPILEAFMSECPVLLSDIRCFKEIAGDAAWYFESKKINSLRSRLEELLYNKQCRAPLIQKANERRDNFSWIKSAEQTAEVYKRVLNG